MLLLNYTFFMLAVVIVGDNKGPIEMIGEEQERVEIVKEIFEDDEEDSSNNTMKTRRYLGELSIIIIVIFYPKIISRLSCHFSTLAKLFDFKKVNKHKFVQKVAKEII